MSPEDVEQILTVWLSPIHRTAITRRVSDPLPFIVVRQVAGKESVLEGTAAFVVSVRTFCAKSLGEDVAADECAKTHLRMLELARDHPDVVLDSGRCASVDYVNVTESPRWDEYQNDQVLVKLARYEIGLGYAE